MMLIDRKTYHYERLQHVMYVPGERLSLGIGNPSWAVNEMIQGKTT